LGVVKNDSNIVQRLKQNDSNNIADNDFEHRSEHSIEFQILFLQHLLGTDSFTIVPILCGSLMENLPAYNRNAYLHEAAPFLNELKEIILEPEKETIIVAGVDFSHIGLKFGHARPAEYMESRAEAHDKNLLKAISAADAEFFWEESKKEEDQYNVCGFPALACLLEILPLCKGKVLDYQLRHEAPTQSAVSFAAVVFTARDTSAS
jgi:AmmeMemoRadiSam system protein B